MDYSSSGDVEKSLDLTEQLMLGYYIEYGLSWERAKRRELLESAEHYHILDGDDFLGFFAFFKKEDHLYVCDLQLLPKYQNKGIGGAAIRFIIGEASSLNLKFIKLSVFKSNNAAMKFYQKRGFTVTEEGSMNFRLSYAIT